jgi:hypothetical protein
MLSTLGTASGEWALMLSGPSLVETGFSDNFGRTLLVHAVKASWWVLQGAYRFMGGCEALVQRIPAG